MSFYWTDYTDLTEADWEGTNSLTGARAPSVAQVEGGMKKPIVDRKKMAGVMGVMSGLEQLASGYYGSAARRDELAIQKSDIDTNKYLLGLQKEQAMTAHYTRIEDTRAAASEDVDNASMAHRDKMAKALVAGEEAGMAGQGRMDMYGMLLKARETDLHNRITNYDKAIDEAISVIHSDNLAFSVAQRNIGSTSAYNYKADLLGGGGGAMSSAADTYYDILYGDLA